VAVFDTNIIIDYLNGYPKAQREFDAALSPLVSIISLMEVLVGVPADVRVEVEAFFAERCKVVPVDGEIARHAITLRIDRKLKLLDAIVLATAYAKNQVLITRDTDFKADDPLVKIPYKL
jgi:predicted nucleic acid-binding protein